MELSLKSRLEIIDYLKSTDAFKDVDIKEVATHLDRLMKNEQLDALENTEGDLLYAWSWYLLTDKALEDYKNFIPPKRIDRGTNMVGVFAINHFLGPTSMLQVIRRNMKMEKASTFTVYTTRKKWVTVQARYGIKRAQEKKVAMTREFFKIINKRTACRA